MNPKRIDLNLLVSLEALIRDANVSHAADRLNLSQPALSAQLKKLREMFDDPLLVPADSGRGMVMTARAIELSVPLRDALHALRTLVEGRPAFDPGTAQRSFCIAANDNAVVVVGLPLMRRVSAWSNPNLQVAFLRPDASRVAGQLEQGTIDLVIGSERMVPPSAKARKLFDERFLMVQRRGHPRGLGALDLDSYCALRHVLVSTSGGSFHGFMDEHLQRLGRRRDVVTSVEQFMLVPALLESSDHVCTLPSRIAALFASTLDSFELPFEAQGFSLYAAWHPSRHADPGMVWLRGALAEALSVDESEAEA
jgi:DNA-binding transcriptional LysR family regulator